MSLVGVVIDIAAEYTGAPAFKKASAATTKLERGVKKLGVTQKLAFAALAAGALAYSKQAAKAAAKDQQAQALLANQLKNVGLAYAAVPVEQFIKRMQEQTGILDDELRPAFAELARVTGSVSKSQDLMNLAFNVAKGSGENYATVVSDLSQAYVGNLKGLRKYNLGLTQAELKAMSFNELQTKIAATFAGAGAASLDTYAGKMSLLTVSVQDAAEVVGGSLIDNMAKLAGNQGIGGVQNGIGKLAIAFGDVFNGLRVVGEQMIKFKAILIPIAAVLLAAFAPVAAAIAAGVFLLSKLGSKNRIAKNNVTPAVQAEVDKSNKAKAAKAEADALKRNRELAKAQNAQLKAAKDAAALKKQGAIFDMQQIQIVAALKRNISDEERTKLELQSALLMGNTEEAARLIKQLANAEGMTKDLRTWLLTLPTAKNPFEAWMAYLDAIQNKLNSLKAPSFMPQGGGGYADFGGAAYEVPTNPYAGTYYGQTGRDMPSNLIITLDGSAFDYAVASSVQNIGRSGININGSASG